MKKPSAPLAWETAPSVLTVDEAASLLRISRNAVYGAIQSGFLPAVNFGQRQIRIAKVTLEKAFGLQAEHVPGTAAFNRDSGGKLI